MSGSTLKPSLSFLLTVYKKKKNLRRAFKEKEWETKKKKKILTALAMTIKRDITMSIRKRGNELKLHKKTVKTAIKQVSSLDLNPLDYAL